MISFRIWAFAGALMLLLGFRLEVRAQSEAESSENVLRVSAPDERNSWVLRPGANVTVQTSENGGHEHTGDIQSIADSAITLHGHAIPLKAIKSIKASETHLQRTANRELIIAAAVFTLAIMSLYATFFTVLLGGPLAFLIGLLVFSGLFLIAVFLLILGLLSTAKASFKAIISNGWRLRISKTTKSAAPKDPVILSE